MKIKDTVQKKRDSAPRVAAVSVRAKSAKAAKPYHGGIVRSFLTDMKSLEDFDRISSGPLIAAILKGLPVRELNDLQKALGLPLETLAPMLGMSKATLHRRKLGGTLTPAESDLIVRYARLVGIAKIVFENEAAARDWLSSPAYGLGGAVPLDFALTGLGAQEVEHLLGRIEYGVFS